MRVLGWIYLASGPSGGGNGILWRWCEKIYNNMHLLIFDILIICSTKFVKVVFRKEHGPFFPPRESSEMGFIFLFIFLKCNFCNEK